MEISQRDRDLLRQSQQKLNLSETIRIGNIVEHRIQDPTKYRSISRQEQGLAEDAKPDLPKINYASLYLLEATEKDRTCRELVSPVRSRSTDSDPSTLPSIEEQDEHSIGLPITPEDVQSNLWLNMDRVEFEKLEWMSDKADRDFLKKLRTSIHFDSNGKAVPPPENSDDAPNQQVHDINSLVKLLDSSFQPQVTYALNVISRIATRATLGFYDAVFDENIHQVLLKECLLRVRHQIDSPNETICQCALKCIRSLICNTQVDEIFLDKLSPLKSEGSDATMWLSFNQENFDIDMKDNDCVQSDAILGLIARTDILARFKYLLNTKTDEKFSWTYHDCILDILIRIARYSRDICWILHNNEFPLLVTENFLPADIVRKSHLHQSVALRAVKFLRIIAQAAEELNHDGEPGSGGPVIKLPSSIIEVVNTYYYIDYEQESSTVSDFIFRIQIETLRLMRSLSSMNEFSGHVLSTLTLDQGTLVDRIRALTKLDVLKPIKSASSLDWQYAASLLDLLSRMMNHERHNSSNAIIQPLWMNFIRPATMVWFNDLIRDRYVPHQDVSIALYVAADIFLHCRNDQALYEFYTVFLSDPFKVIDPTADINLIYFRYLVREATNGSSLSTFQKNSGCRRDPSMLPSYGFMNFNTSNQYSYKLNNIIGKDTPYILLNLYFILLQKSYKRFESLMSFYVDNVDLVRYMRTATCYHNYPMSYELEVQRSVLAQLEVRILANAGLLLSKYYLLTSRDGTPDTNCDHIEPKVLAEKRAESYSQLVLDVYSMIGLMNPEIEYMLDVKDALLEKVIFDECFQFRFALESFRSPEDEVYKNLKFYRHKRFSPNCEFMEDFSLDETDLLVLRAVYLSCEQPGRFWIFQPLIEYYSFQIRDYDEAKRVKDGKWFLHNINKNSHGKFLPADCDDANIFRRMLKLNALLMLQSPAYFEIAIRQNIEEYLCLIGSVFLDENLFLDKKVNIALWYNLEMIISLGLRTGIKSLFCDASRKILTLDMPLIDFFNRLVDQYEAASYNDVVFTNYLLLFLSPDCDKLIKKKLFSDKLETCLSQMRIARAEVWIPQDLLFKDKERDPEIKSLIKLSRAYVNRSQFLLSYLLHHAS